MINKYALGTIVGTALLGVAKSKLGSSAQIKLKESDTFTYMCGTNLYGGNLDLLSNMIQTGHLNNIIGNQDVMFELNISDDEDQNDTLYIIYKGYDATESQAYAYGKIFDTYVSKIKSELNNNNIVCDDDYNDFNDLDFNKENALCILNKQTGEWEIYKSPEPLTRLRKR